jgi:hypothetical protein
LAPVERDSDLWSLTPRQLAQRMDAVGEAGSGADPATQTEAGELAVEWREAIALPAETFEEQQARAARLDALQRRSIEILVRVGEDSAA